MANVSSPSSGNGVGIRTIQLGGVLGDLVRGVGSLNKNFGIVLELDLLIIRGRGREKTDQDLYSGNGSGAIRSPQSLRGLFAELQSAGAVGRGEGRRQLSLVWSKVMCMQC